MNSLHCKDQRFPTYAIFDLAFLQLPMSVVLLQG